MTADRDAYLGLVVAGWVMAFCLPIGGLIVGCLLLSRRPGHGVGVVVVSAVGLAVAFFVTLVLLDPVG